MVSRACRETVSKCVHRLPNVSVWLDRQVLCQSRSNRPARMSKKNNYTATCALDSRVLEILDEFRYVCHSQFTFIILSTRRNDVQYGYHHHEQLLGSHVVLWAASSALDATSAMILGLQHLITCCSFATWIFQASKSDHAKLSLTSLKEHALVFRIHCADNRTKNYSDPNTNWIDHQLVFFHFTCYQSITWPRMEQFSSCASSI